MGVAGLFSFLRRRYPEIVEACAQQAEELADGEAACDNLYIDLNHIIHACTHPSWREEAHVSEVEQFMEVDVYLHRLVALMRPTRVLLVAVDGSAPVAKMNQQRGRRFYAAHLERQRLDIERQVRREMAAEMGPLGGGDIPPGPAFDGNVITPGTSFMHRLGEHLRTFFRQKVESDPDWAHLAVIFSDSSEPGEGEHKVMRFIRQQRTRPDYDPNTRHALFGQDADLILLGLLSHEPHFCLLRESGRLEAVLEGAEGDELDALWSPVGQQPLEVLRLSTLRDFLRCEFSEFCAEEEQAMGSRQQAGVAGPAASQAEAEDGGGSPGAGSGSSTGGGNRGRNTVGGDGLGGQEGEVDLITGERVGVHPSVARRRARQQQAAASEAPGGGGGGDGSGKGGGAGVHNFERILDDVVFCTFLAGNDFLPHVPSLDIYDRPSALETLLDQYKELLRHGAGGGGRRGYLTSSGRVDPDKLCWLFQKLGAGEDTTFQQRELRKVREQRRKLQQEAAAGPDAGGSGRPTGASWLGGGEWVSVGELGAEQSLEEALAGVASGGNLEVPSAALWAGDPARLRRELLKRVRERMDDRAQAGMAADRVRLSIAGYRGRYYQRCFGADAPAGPDLEKLVRRVCAAYCRTLVWVMSYYTRGSPPIPPPGAAGAAAAEQGSAGRRSERDSDDAVPYASWQVFYEWHYAPLASDLAKYGREALRGAAAASARPGAPLPPFAQLLCVLPFSSMPACLPTPLAREAQDADEGLAALHGAAGADVFPEDVGALVDLSGKKWAHTAVVTLPFPDVGAITQFVSEQLEDEEGCRLSTEERSRNSFAPALLFLSAFHPLAQRLLGGGTGTAGAAGDGDTVDASNDAAPAAAPAAAAAGLAPPSPAAEGQDVPEGSSILSLLPPLDQQPAAEWRQQEVLCVPLDIAGQDTPAFSPGLLPGTEEGERAVSLQAWNRRKLNEQRKQADRAAAGLRGRGGRSRGAGGGRGRGGRGDRGGSAFYGAPGGGGSRGAGVAFAAPAPLLPPLPPPAARQHHQHHEQLYMKQQHPGRQQQQTTGQGLSDEELARQLQEQFDAEARGERQSTAAAEPFDAWGASLAGGSSCAPVPPGVVFSRAGMVGDTLGASAGMPTAGARCAPVPPPPPLGDSCSGADEDDSGQSSAGAQPLHSGGWGSGEHALEPALSVVPAGAQDWPDAEVDAEAALPLAGAGGAGEPMPWLAPVAPPAQLGTAESSSRAPTLHAAMAGGPTAPRLYAPLAAARVGAEPALGARAAGAVVVPAAPAASADEAEGLDDMLALLGVQ